MIDDPSSHPDTNGRNWLGHGESTGGHQVDTLLLSGATTQTLDDIVVAGNPYRNFRNHIRGLTIYHGLEVTHTQGIHRFDRQKLAQKLKAPARQSVAAPQASPQQ